MDGITVIHSGYLKKSPPERRLWRTWHKRYFVLKSNKTITYYPSERDTKPVKDPVDLSQCLSIEANLRHNNKNFKHVFGINTKNRTYYLVAESQKDMETWVKLLCRECGFEKQDGKTSPDFLRNKSSPKQSKHSVQNTHCSPTMHSSPAICPLSHSMPTLVANKSRTLSDPPDSSEIIKRAEEEYKTATLNRRRSTGVAPRDHLTLPVRGPDLSRVSECYDPVPPPKASPSRNRASVVDRGYVSPMEPSPRTPEENYVLPRRRPSTSSEYDFVPKPRPASEVYDIVPPHRSASQETDDEIYDSPPTFRNSQGYNYDTVPLPRPASQNGQDQLYDFVPKHNSDELYDTLPNRPNSTEEDTYDFPPREVYDMVPPPRPKPFDSNECYDTLPPATSDNDIYDSPPSFTERNNKGNNQVPPPRPPKMSNGQAQELYDIVPPPQSLASSKKIYSDQRENAGPFPENRDSGSYSDDIYDTPPKVNTTAQDNDIYDVPPKISPDGDIYDILPKRSENEDIYDVPPAQVAVSPPSVDRTSKPPPVNLSIKLDNHDYTNMAPPVNRKNKPPTANRDGGGQHSYENLKPLNQRGMFSKSNSLPETFDVPKMQMRNKQETEYFDMQPYRSDETRCYSFSKEQESKMTTNEAYEEMEPIKTHSRESGVHSNSSSSEDGEEDCYMTMNSTDQDIKSTQRRSASLQYCEVEIVEGQSKCQIPVAKRSANSHYTTINEESTKAFRQTCRQQELSHKK